MKKFQIQGQLNSKSFFIKSVPLENASKREAISQIGFFRKEVFFFENLQSKLTKYSGKSEIRRTSTYQGIQTILL